MAESIIISPTASPFVFYDNADATGKFPAGALHCVSSAGVDEGAIGSNKSLPVVGTVTVGGTVAVSNLPATQPVSGTVALTAGTQLIGKVGRKRFSVTTTFNRPADTNIYAVGDAVSSSVTTNTTMQFSNVVPANGGSGRIDTVVISIATKSITPGFILHLFTTAPTVAGDNVAYKSLNADIGKETAQISVPALSTPTDATNSDNSKVLFNCDVPFQCDAGSTSLLWLLELFANAWTPANAVLFTATISGTVD